MTFRYKSASGVAKMRLTLAAGLACGLVITLLCCRSGEDQILVYLTDSQTGYPVTNATIRIQQYHRVPLLYNLKFLPFGLRQTTSSRFFDPLDGSSFRLERASRDSSTISAFITIEQNGRRAADLRYTASGFSSDDGITTNAPLPVPKNAKTIVIPLNLSSN